MNEGYIKESVQLGTGGIIVKPLGIGTWAWGDKMMWGYGKGGYSDDDLKEAFDACLEDGVNLFDTAEIYGSGQSETLLGQFINSADKRVIVASKFMPHPWRLRAKSLLDALRNSLDRLGLEKIDLYQIHFPVPIVSIETWMEMMAQAVEDGLITSVGVSNYSVAQTRRAHEALSNYNIPLATNQVEYSLLNRKVERNGLLQVCEELGVKVIAYSPLAQGMLTGKYGIATPPSGLRGWRNGRKRLDRIEKIVAVMRDIGKKYANKTASQVALNWAIQKGTIPIPGVKNLRQARENLGALGWKLQEVDMKLLDKMAW